jgi:DNA-binding PadR family transcriptional regulator
VVLDGYVGSCIGSQGPRGYYRGMMSWRAEVTEIIVQLEDQRRRLEEVRERAKRQGGPEGERLEAQAEARLRDIEQRIDDLRASLE